MNPEDENKVRQNWEIIKQEINTDDFVTKFINLGVFRPAEAQQILNGIPGTLDSKSNRFLEAVINGGNKYYQTMCNIILDNSRNPRYKKLAKILGIDQDGDSGVSVCPSQRPGTSVSVASSLSLNLGACAENISGDRMERMVSARAPWREELPRHEEHMDSSEADQEDNRPSTPSDAVHMAVQKASDSKSGALDMETLEKELVKIAPTIADLFSKIHTQTTTVVAQSEEELKKIKEDNDRLRKTNRTLVEKLNSFQQKIIQLQLENKKLREFNDNEKVKQNQLDEKSTELEKLKDKLIEQKKALEEKEKELDMQMNKLQTVINDNEEQKFKLANLEQLHEEGVREHEQQQKQIEELQKEKEQQKEKIQALEEKQSLSEQLLYRMEERLLMLERGSPKRTRPRFGPTRPWMNGMLEKSHHANVKPQPQFPADFSSNMKGGKGWAF